MNVSAHNKSSMRLEYFIETLRSTGYYTILFHSLVILATIQLWIAHMYTEAG